MSFFYYPGEVYIYFYNKKIFFTDTWYTRYKPVQDMSEN